MEKKQNTKTPALEKLQGNKHFQERNEAKPLDNDELRRVVGDLSQQNQTLIKKLKQYEEALNQRSFDYMSFFLSMLFKVTEHVELYPEDFKKWVVDNIQGMLISFASSLDEANSGKTATDKPEDETK